MYLTSTDQTISAKLHNFPVRVKRIEKEGGREADKHPTGAKKFQTTTNVLKHQINMANGPDRKFSNNHNTFSRSIADIKLIRSAYTAEPGVNPDGNYGTTHSSLTNS